LQRTCFIWLAVQQPFKAVAVKSEMRQAMLALHRIREWKKEDPEVEVVSEVPGVGLLTATAAAATTGDAKVFRSGREFAAGVGIVPKQTGTGGKINLHGISKRGRHVSAHLADPRRAQRVGARQETRRVGRADEEVAAVQRGRGGLGQQDGAHDLGGAGTRSGVSNTELQSR
jgi:transposase